MLSFGADVGISLNDQNNVGIGAIPNVSIGSFEAEWRRARLGIAVARTVSEVDALSILPLSVGYTIWQRPNNYAGRLFSHVPEVYARLTADWASGSIVDQFMDNPSHSLTAGTLDLVAALDGFGGGLSLSAGVAASIDSARYSRPDSRSSLFVTPFVAARIRIPTFTAGF